MVQDTPGQERAGSLNIKQKVSSRRKVPEMNQNVDPVCKLANGERWGAIFHHKNIENLSLPKVNNTEVCLKYHINVKWHLKCARKSTHVVLHNTNLIGLRSYIKSAKDNHAEFLAKRTERMNITKSNENKILINNIDTTASDEDQK